MWRLKSVPSPSPEALQLEDADAGAVEDNALRLAAVLELVEHRRRHDGVAKGAMEVCRWMCVLSRASDVRFAMFVSGLTARYLARGGGA
jgi:hypothetical protein